MEPETTGRRRALDVDSPDTGSPQAILDELIARYQGETNGNVEIDRNLRRKFLLSLIRLNSETIDERYVQFLAAEISPEDFAGIEWEGPDQAIFFCEMIYSVQMQDEAMERRVKMHVRALLRQALHQFERQGQPEKMFKLLQIAPVSPDLDDGELRRLRNRAYLYEMRRVQRHRRILYSYLIIQVILIAFVFPLLFINAENGLIQDQIEQSTELELPEETRSFYSYTDGLYWALITAASIGYGDITPATTIGRIIAATLGVMGVITIGVIAGLILEWISPRRLD